jgi:hypothetical protein
MCACHPTLALVVANDGLKKCIFFSEEQRGEWAKGL